MHLPGAVLVTAEVIIAGCRQAIIWVQGLKRRGVGQLRTAREVGATPRARTCWSFPDQPGFRKLCIGSAVNIRVFAEQGRTRFVRYTSLTTWRCFPARVEPSAQCAQTRAVPSWRTPRPALTLPLS